MAIQKIHIEQALTLAKSLPVFDVRSPSEYAHAHIPGAISLPIFDDAQRAEIGTSYKQSSVQDAIKIGLKHFGHKLNDYISIVEEHAKTISNSEIILHCWRGGMRSQAMAWVLDFYGYDVYLIIGGYKAYRNHVLNSFQLPIEFNVLGGSTGSAKTFILEKLKEMRESVIDLEGIAQHRGSSFGALGMPIQPSQEQFENNLHKELSNYFSIDEEQGYHQPKKIWIENESQRIGLVNIPKVLFERMLSSKLVVLQIPFEERLKLIVEQYGKFTKEELIDATIRIQKKLGGLETKNVISFLEVGNIYKAFELLLMYYDRGYKAASSRTNRIPSILVLEKIDMEQNAIALLNFANGNRRN
jgi:tRNA 2-selenouridine synthase